MFFVGAHRESDRFVSGRSVCSSPAGTVVLWGEFGILTSNLGIYGQGSQKLYNWEHIVSPPHYRNGVHHPVEIICLYCGGHRDFSEYI